jgi:hypothetical protein
MNKDCPPAVSQYHLSGEDVKIAFHRGDQETTTLEYNGKIFRGDALHHEQTALGLLVSAVVETVPDLHTVSLTLAVPEVNPAPDEKSVHVSTFAILTTSRTSIGGPGLVHGQLQTYKHVPLKGKAS